MNDLQEEHEDSFISYTLHINGVDIPLTKDKLENLYKELKNIFEKDTIYYPITSPYYPVTPVPYLDPTYISDPVPQGPIITCQNNDSPPSS
jgi:hypothetical protein